MFTPEFSSADGREVVLIANHNLESEESRAMSIAFIGRALPSEERICRRVLKEFD